MSVDPKGNGGDFEKGSCSQEEEVWRRTTYSAVAGATQFLPLSGAAVRYVPSVQLLRQGESAGYAFSTAPVVLAFIAACAVKEPAVNLVGKYSDDDTNRMKQTIRAMFGCAMQHGHDAIVIPAFGCGFNKNNPAIVAALFHDVLVSEYPKSFKHVTFAIQNDVNGPANFETFQVGKQKKKKKMIMMFSNMQLHRLLMSTEPNSWRKQKQTKKQERRSKIKNLFTRINGFLSVFSFPCPGLRRPFVGRD